MHESGDGAPAFVFDLVEPHRATIDRKILEFVKGHVFDPADFVIRSDGACRLNPKMARCIARVEVQSNSFRQHGGGFLSLDAQSRPQFSRAGYVPPRQVSSC
jgi:CRISPR/Cas system-associated endonuclease Cas1